MPKPQEMWMHDIDNTNEPFIPKLVEKPNAIIPLDDSIVLKETESNADVPDRLKRHIQSNLGISKEDTNTVSSYVFILSLQ